MKKQSPQVIAALIAAIAAIICALISGFVLLRSSQQGADIENKANEAKKLYADLQHQAQFPFVPTGTILAYGGELNSQELEMKGWLPCDGTPRSTNGPYNSLFNAIGYAWGRGETADQFSLPDLRGVFLRGVNGSRQDSFGDPERDARTNLVTGGFTGNRVGSFQLDEVGPHDHKIGIFQNRMDANERSDPRPYVHQKNLSQENTSPKDYTTSSAINEGVETHPKNACVNFIIKM